MAWRHCEDCGGSLPPYAPRKLRKADGKKVCPACMVRPGGGLVSSGKKNLGATAVADDLSAHEDQMKGSEGAAIGQHLWDGMAKSMGYHDGEHMQIAKQNHMSGVLHERYGENNGGEHGIDANGDPHYTVTHHPSGWTARTYGGPMLEIGHKGTPDEAHDALDVSDDSSSRSGIHPAMTNGSPEGNHHMLTRHLHAWVNDYGDDFASSIPKVKHHQRIHSLSNVASIQPTTAVSETGALLIALTVAANRGRHVGHRHASLGQKIIIEAHDSGDGETIYHCPFCGSGQVLARSDRTIECEFCHTCFTVQVQPQYSAFPQTINGVPVEVPGMPGQVGPDPMGGAGTPGEDPLGGQVAPDDAPPPFGAPGGDQDPAAAGQGPAGADDDQEDPDADDEDDADSKMPPWLKGGSASFKTASGVELGSEDYLAHLALAHATPEERARVLEARRG